MSYPETMGYKAPTAAEVQALMQAAHKERALYIAELFGFGFATAKKGLAGFRQKAEAAGTGSKPAAA